MDRLPPELVLHIAYYLDAFDIVKLHLVSKSVRKITRDGELWKRLCFEDSNSAANRKRRDLQFIAPSIFQEPARVFELQRRARALSGLASDRKEESISPTTKKELSERSRAIADWDPSYTKERVDWYEEYIARNAPINLSWLQGHHDHGFGGIQEVKGMGIHDSGAGPLAVAPLEDGGLVMWNIGRQDDPEDKNWGSLIARTRAGLLSSQSDFMGTYSGFRLSLGGVGNMECVSVDRVRNKAYFTSHNDLDEIDLETLQITSHERYPFAISALSEAAHPVPITVATTHSLHLHDPRLPKNTSPSGYDQDAQVESSTASLPPSSQGSGNFYQSLHEPSRTQAPSFDTGPLSISHLPTADNQHDVSSGHISVAGRFPSILTYNRRMFPRLSSTIHSGSRLASMISLPHPLLYPRSNPPSNPNAAHTLIACGEYNGKGSLEFYPFSTSDEPNPPLPSPYESRLAPITPYKNRTSASSSKLLSVAAHGTRIVFSDGDGGLKWVERDGHSLVRRWNINAYTASARTATHPVIRSNIFSGSSTNDGGDVARQILPVGSWEDGKGELAVWTGERIGVLGFRPKPRFEWEQERDGMEYEDEDREYAGQMRRALQLQADEVRFVRGLGLS
ncbi:MAG: hypothetical protein Q9169_000528 [Polycauliona sp. 2 TL-2023]